MWFPRSSASAARRGDRGGGLTPGTCSRAATGCAGQHHHQPRRLRRVRHEIFLAPAASTNRRGCCRPVRGPVVKSSPRRRLVVTQHFTRFSRRAHGSVFPCRARDSTGPGPTLLEATAPSCGAATGYLGRLADGWHAAAPTRWRTSEALGVRAGLSRPAVRENRHKVARTRRRRTGFGDRASRPRHSSAHSAAAGTLLMGSCSRSIRAVRGVRLPRPLLNMRASTAAGRAPWTAEFGNPTSRRLGIHQGVLVRVPR